MGKGVILKFHYVSAKRHLSFVKDPIKGDEVSQRKHKQANLPTNSNGEIYRERRAKWKVSERMYSKSCIESTYCKKRWKGNCLDCRFYSEKTL